MEKGAKTSEFYIVLAVLIPWISQQFGIDLSALLASPDDIAGMIQAAHDKGSDTPVMVAGLYIVGRILRKWRAGQ